MFLETIVPIMLPWLGQWVTETIASSILNKANSQLNKNDIDKALKRSINAAEEATKKQLFFKYDDKQIRSFLNDYFQNQVLEQLRNPLLEQSIDLEFLEFAFKQTIENNPDKYNKIQQDYIKPWLEVFKTEYLKEIGTYINYQYAKVKYFKQLANRYDDVKFSGIEVEGQEIDKSEQLLKIFVMQDVKEEKKERYSRLRETAFFTSDDNQISRQQELFRQQREASDLANYGENSFSAQQLLTKNKSKKVVLLGAPGSGKTTLMSYFSVAITENKANLLGLDPNIDWLPIFIRMRDYILHNNLGILDYYCSEFCDKDLSVKQLPDGFFEHWLETGRALILLDGLDEIVDEGKRNEIVKNIDNFISSYDQNSVIITSRPAGYRRDFFDAETFPHYWLQPFDDEQISEFIENWYNSRTADETEAKARKDDIRKALDNNPRIKLLARNPLLLTIIALIHRYQAQLPKQRHELYERAVKTLLTTWDTNKLLKKHTKLQYLENDDWYDIMRNLAHWIHGYQEGIEGNELEGTLIDKKELIKFLTNYIETKKKIDFDYAEQEAERFLNFIRDRSGLLNEQGTDCYGFVHKTFQEYLCAQKIRQDMKRKRYDFQIILDAITNHLHDAHWREVLLLLIAQEEEESAAAAIKVILNHNSKYEKWLHRDLLFAGSCLAENPKGLKNVEKDEEEEKDLIIDILERLVNLEISEPKIDGLRKELFKVFCSLYETDFADQCLELLKAESNKIEQDRLLTYRAELGEQETVINELIKQLSDQSQSDSVRQSAADALGALGKDSEEVISALLTALSDQSLSEDVRRSVADALGRLRKDSEEIISALLNALFDQTLSRFVRELVAYALRKLGKDSEEMISALLNVFSDQTLSDDLRRSAVYPLKNLGTDSEGVISALLNVLSDQSLSDDLRQSAADALGRLRKDSEEIISALLKALSDQSLSDDLRQSAASALGKLGKDSEEVISALLNVLSDQSLSDDLRRSSASALGKLGKDSEEVISALLNVFSDQSLSDDLRRSVAEALGKLGKDSEEVISALLNALSDQSWLLRVFTVEALGKLGKDSEEVISALVNALSDQSWLLHTLTVEALENFGKTSNQVLPLIVEWIETNENSEFVGNGIEVLWRLVA